MEFDIVSFSGAVILVFLICVLIKAANNSKKGIGTLSDKTKNQEIRDYLLQIAGFMATQQIIGTDEKSALAIDEQKRKICLIDYGRKNLTCRIISYKDLLSSEIFEDGETVTSTVRSSQIGGALIGALALGGIGAVIGGLSGKTKSSDKVKYMVLRLIVNDTKNPLHEIEFLKFITKKSDSEYRKAMQQARHWHGLIEILIKRADIEDKENAANNVVQISQSSIADEIKKLSELRDAGILSDVEFQQQKEKLLG